MKCYVLFLYGVFTVDAVAVDFVDFFDIAVVDCGDIVLVVNVTPNFNTKKYISCILNSAIFHYFASRP